MYYENIKHEKYEVLHNIQYWEYYKKNYIHSKIFNYVN